MSPTHDIDIHRKLKVVAPTRQRNANSSVRMPQSLALQAIHIIPTIYEGAHVHSSLHSEHCHWATTMYMV